MMAPDVNPRQVDGKRRRWGFLIGAAVIAIVAMASAGFVFLDAILGTSLERSRSAYGRGDFEGSLGLSDRWLAGHPDDPEATRVRARSLARLGRGDEACAAFARLGGERLQAEDFALIGDALVKSNRHVLGLAAFAAASKVEPGDRRHGGMPVPPQAAPEDDLQTTKRAEQLAAIPSAAGLGELVLALAVADGPSSRASAPSLLERVLRLDRSTLVAIDGPSATHKLMARLMLEDGKAAEARSWLARGSAPDDLETNWLLSRAWLADRELEKAATAAASAREFGEDDHTRPEPAPYVGASRCAECHSKIFASHQKTGHAETFKTADGMNSVPLPRLPTLQDPGNPEVVHRFERDPHGLRLESKVNGQVVRAVLDYALGSGRHGMTMLGHQESGRHRTLRLSYYSTGGEHWDLTSGMEKRPEDAEAYIGPPLNEESFVKCLNCHTTRFNSERERTGPEAADRGIGCERCHGPADHHLRSVELGFSDPAIARPKSATPSQRLKVCAQCHGADGVIPPSDPRFVRFQAANLPFSRCLTESGGRLDCVACHDPHRGLETDRRYYEVRCLACHDGAAAPPKALPPGIRVEAVASKPCPINAKTGCVDCHMPKAKEVMPFTDFTDHHIRVHRAADPPPSGANLDGSRAEGLAGATTDHR